MLSTSHQFLVFFLTIALSVSLCAVLFLNSRKLKNLESTEKSSPDSLAEIYSKLTFIEKQMSDSGQLGSQAKLSTTSTENAREVTASFMPLIAAAAAYKGASVIKPSFFGFNKGRLKDIGLKAEKTPSEKKANPRKS